MRIGGSFEAQEIDRWQSRGAPEAGCEIEFRDVAEERNVAGGDHAAECGREPDQALCQVELLEIRSGGVS